MLGRQTSDQVTTLGSGVDGSVRRIDTAYDTQGNPSYFTSYATTGTSSPVNQVYRAYNGLSQLIAEYQSHYGLVNTGVTPKVQYTYSEMAGSANHSRLTSIIYPGTGNAAKTVNYNYATGVDNTISRLTSLTDNNGVTLESYKYLGLGTVVERDHPQTNVNLTYISQTGSTGDAGDKYIGLDRFGRVVDQNWWNPSTSTSTDRFQYSYDRDSNRLTRTNVVNTAFNETYTYDNLNQLATFARGTHTQSWSPDAAGNFNSVTTDGTPVSRTNNKLNEVTQVGTSNLTFDANGNTTTDDFGKTLVYDAWNRLVAYKNGSTGLESFQYDGVNRRIATVTSIYTDLYYSSSWQVLEERVGGIFSVTNVQQVWSPVYVDALVLRDRDPNGSGTLSERLYAQQEANWDVTALVNTSATVVERYDYDPYGKVTFLNVSWGTLSSSAYAWSYLHQGGRYDVSIGLYYFRMRDYSPTLIRWMQNDPLGFVGSNSNLYDYVGDDPINAKDPSGLTQQKAGKVEIKPATFATVFSEWKAYVTNGVDKKFIEDLDLKEDTNRWKKYGDQSFVWNLEPLVGGGVRSLSVASAVRFSAEMNGCDAYIIQSWKGEITLKGKRIVLERSFVDFIEFFGVDNKGTAVAPDVHTFTTPTLSANGDYNSFDVALTATVGVGIYDNMKEFGDHGGKLKKKGIYDKVNRGDPKKINWLGPTTTYKIRFTANDAGTWTYEDESIKLKKTDKDN